MKPDNQDTPAGKGGPSPFSFAAPEWANTHPPEDADGALKRAREVAESYYPLGVQTGIHSMIEWCGVMGEYVKMLRFAHEAGVDPREVDQHHDQAVDVPDYQIDYLAEKLGCQLIPFIRANPEYWRKRIDQWFKDMP